MQVDNYKEAQLYTGNGITTQFDFYFSFGATAEIKVFVAGEELASNQYSVSSVNYQSGGTVICLVAPILNAAIRIERQTPFTQESAFSNFNQVDLKKLETSLDKMVRIEQELRNAIDISAESNFQNQIDAISDVLTEVSEFTQDIDDVLQEHKENTENPHSVTKTQVGLGNVNNTSDANKPISTATQTALNAKANLSGATFTDAISATNLSGTNTGDETDSTIKTKLGITTLSGSNTGDQDLSGYALDDEVVHLAGTETITGVKTFNASPIVPTPTTDIQVANKGYVDTNIGGSSILPSGTCSTAGATAAKEVTVAGYTEAAGKNALITFENKNTALGPNLYIPFTGGTAADPLGVYTLTTIGSPTYTGDKFNSNGNSGLSYNISSMGAGAWCVQGKFKSTNTTTGQQLMASDIHFGFLVSKFTDNKLVLNLSGNGTTWSIVAGLSGTKNDWATNTEYYIRVRFSGTAYYVDWSLDGSSWTNEITHTSSTPIYSAIGGLRFGIYYDNSTPLIGTMDDLYVSIGSATTITDYPTLNINSGGAKYLCHADGTRITPVNPAYFIANCPIQFCYDGTGYRFKQEVVKTYVNGTTYYNLSNDGWVKHAYRVFGQTPTTTTYTLTFVVPMLDSNYSALIKAHQMATSNNPLNEGYAQALFGSISSLTSTTIQYRCGALGASIIIEGFAA